MGAQLCFGGSLRSPSRRRLGGTSLVGEPEEAGALKVAEVRPHALADQLDESEVLTRGGAAPALVLGARDPDGERVRIGGRFAYDRASTSGSPRSHGDRFPSWTAFLSPEATQERPVQRLIAGRQTGEPRAQYVRDVVERASGQFVLRHSLE